MKNQWEWQVIDESKPDGVLARGRFAEATFEDAQRRIERDLKCQGEWVEIEYCGGTSLAFEMQLDGAIVELSTIHYNYAPHPSLKYHY